MIETPPNPNAKRRSTCLAISRGRHGASTTCFASGRGRDTASTTCFVSGRGRDSASVTCVASGSDTHYSAHCHAETLIQGVGGRAEGHEHARCTARCTERTWAHTFAFALSDSPSQAHQGVRAGIGSDRLFLELLYSAREENRLCFSFVHATTCGGPGCGGLGGVVRQ